MKLKKLICLLLVLFTALPLAACGDEDYIRNIPGYEEGKTNIVYYTWGTAEENAIINDIIDDFKAENEDINIILQKAGNDYYSDLEYTLSGNRSPDIVQMKPGYIASYMKSGSIIPLQSYIDKSEHITAEMLWEANDGYRYDKASKKIGEGDIYSLIKDFSPDFALNYNKNKITESVKNAAGYPVEEGTVYPSLSTPMTFSQFREFGKAVKTANMTGTHLDNEPYQQILEWIQMSGGSLYSDGDKKVADVKNDPAIRAAFDHYRLMLDEASDNTPIAKKSSVQVGPGQLKQGQTASIFYGRWAYTAYGLDSASGFEYGFAPPAVPDNIELNENTKYAGITAMVGLSISAKSKNKDAAFKFIEYYFTEGQKKLASLGFNIPGNKLVAQNEFVAESLPAKERDINRFFLDLAVNRSFVIKFNNYISQGAVEDVFSKHLSAYFADSKGKKYSEVRFEKALDDLKADLQKKLDLAVSRS